LKSKVFIWLLVVAVVLSMAFIGIGCKVEEVKEEVKEEAEEEVAEEAEEVEESSETYTLGLLGHTVESEFGRVFADALIAACEEMGFKYQHLDAAFDVNTQISQAETLITNQVDGIIIVPVDASGSVPALDKISDAGIPCVVANMLIDSDKYLAYVGSDDTSVGEDITNWIIDKLEGKGNVVVMQGQLGCSAEMQRTEGIQNVLNENPDINVLEMQTANWSRAEAMALMENWLTTHGDKIDAVIAENDEMAIGAMQAVEAQNLDKKIWIIGVDGLVDAINAIKDGTMDCTFLQNASGQARGAVETMAKILNGEQYEKEVWIPFQEINADNVDEFIK